MHKLTSIKHLRSKSFFFFVNGIMLVTEKSEYVLICRVSKVMDELQSWFYINLLMLNTEKQWLCCSLLDKIEIISIITGSTTLNRVLASLNSKDIVCKQESKFIGMYISANMKQDVHLKSLSSKFRKVCYIITSLNDIINPYAVRNILHILMLIWIMIWLLGW